MKMRNICLSAIVFCGVQFGCSRSGQKDHSETHAREIASIFGIDSNQVVLMSINPRREGVAIYQLPVDSVLVESEKLRIVVNRPRCIEDIEYAYKTLGASFPVKGDIVEVQSTSNKYLSFKNGDSRIVVAFSDQ